MEIFQWKHICLNVVYLCKQSKAVLTILFSFPSQEQLNIMLFELAQRLHNALSKVDISFYTAVKDGQSQSQGSCAPLCNHMHPAKLVMVKKEGQNKVLFIPCVFTLRGWKYPLLSLFFLLVLVLMDFFSPLPSLAGSFVLCLWCPKSWAMFLFQVDWRCEPHRDKIQTECSAPWHKKYWDIPQESKDCCLWGMPAFGEVSWNAVHFSQLLCEFKIYEYSSSSAFQQDLTCFLYI